MPKGYDSISDTQKHIARVAELLQDAVKEFAERAEFHDRSKLEKLQKQYFDKFTPLLRESVFGSHEYKSFLEQLRPALDDHYSKESHHPEHYPNGISGMNLFDLLEMLLDWKASTERHIDNCATWMTYYLRL